MLRKLVVALAAGALITSFSIATPTPSFAAKHKKAKAAKVQPAPHPLACIAGIVFLPIKVLTKQPIC
jgi:hypothetical protein